MPKVSNIEVDLREYGFGKMRQQVHYSSRKEYFYIEIPEAIKGAIRQEFQSICRDGLVTGETMHKVKENFEEMLEEYKKKMTTKRKVISYSTKTSYVEKDQERIKEIEKERGIDGSPEIKIDFEVVYELTFNGKKDYISIGKYAQSTYPGKIIAWTPEREDFFVQLKARMEGLILKIDEFFANDKKALQAIDSGQKLLK